MRTTRTVAPEFRAIDLIKGIFSRRAQLMNEPCSMCFTGPGFAQKTHVEEVETGEKFELLVFAKVSHHLTYRFLSVNNRCTVKFILRLRKNGQILFSKKNKFF